MDITVKPGKLSGVLDAIPSKSHAHRLLICSALADGPVKLNCPATNQDMDATADCLNALGAQITRTQEGYHIVPIAQIPDECVLNCRESGSTLRFMLPVAAALGVNATFQMAGRLPQRPLSPLWEELEAHGVRLSRPTANTIALSGRLQPGEYQIDGGISSQFITGLLLALPLLSGKSRLTVTGNVESRPYITLTEQVLAAFGVSAQGGVFSPAFPFTSPGCIRVEGDWSNAAFFFGANAIGNSVTVQGLCSDSAQGDRAVCQLSQQLADNITVYGQDIPDLIPILAVVAGACRGARFEKIGRLRLKESDRIDAVARMLRALGCPVQTGADWMQVCPASFRSCTVDAQNDHRIAMAAAIAATVAQGPVTILGAECVSKSYPEFWNDFNKLGGNYEQHIR